ncbi:SdpI/YhfL protein family protein [uncultured archaeon]|nr:SdpI/YhfL protein family protein [uncultured archaeon]
MKKFVFVLLAVVLLSFLTSLYLYPVLPDKFVSHWSTDFSTGTFHANGFTSKFLGAFLLPLISLIFIVLYFLLPVFDPLKSNYKKFESYYNGFFLVLFLFFYYIHLLSLLANLGYSINFVYCLIPAIAILFYCCGILVENSKRNYFVGVRTPWALHSDVVWDKTNKRGGFLFKILSLICLIGLFLGNYAFILLLIACFLFLAYILYYSYSEFKKLKNN